MQDQTASLANPFLCPEFAVVIGRSQPAARVAVLTDSRGRSGSSRSSAAAWAAAAPIGAGLSDCQGLVHAPGAQWDPAELLRGCGIVAWHFDHLAPGSGRSAGSRPRPRPPRSST